MFSLQIFSQYYVCFLLLIISIRQLNHTLFLIQNPPDWQEILLYFRGSELQNYFTKILEDDLKVLS